MNTDFLTREADRCVKCGLCLPHCPTYQLARDEAESPRGRIALIQGWVSGDLDADQPLLDHLDHCLLCRRCETACPSDVKYAALMDAARESLSRKVPQWLPDMLAHSDRQRMGLRLAAVAMKSGMKTWFPSKVVRRLLSISAAIAESKPGSGAFLNRHYAANGPVKGEVALFSGCMQQSVDMHALQAAVRILTAIGYVVSVPSSQQCCGAMHAHAGYRQCASELEKSNLAAFSSKEYAALITVSSGCGSHLADLSGLDCAVMDAAAFVQQNGGVRALHVAEIRRKIAILVPCTLAAMGQQKQVLALLHELPGAELFELQGMGCCGGAGLNLVTRQEIGRQLVKPLIKQLAATGANIVVTTNSGCALQLQMAASKAGLGIRVAHPLELVVEQLEQRDEQSLFPL